jgi:hypothetical protein
LPDVPVEFTPALGCAFATVQKTMTRIASAIGDEDENIRRTPSGMKR